MAVPDGNGAGIRLEKGNLNVTRSMFRNSEEGILTGGDPSGEIMIDQSTFSGLGRCDGEASCAHSIYVGDFGSLTVTRSRFERGNGGHYVKSRAARAIIQNNAFDDTRGKATNYMIDLPNGAIGMINGNMFVQGAARKITAPLSPSLPKARRTVRAVWRSAAMMPASRRELTGHRPLLPTGQVTGCRWGRTGWDAV